MTNWIDEGNECLESDSLYSAKEYRRIIRGLIYEVAAKLKRYESIYITEEKCENCPFWK